MSAFGETLFSGSPLIRWLLVPILVLNAILFGFVLFGAVLARDYTVITIALGLIGASLFLALGLLVPRCSWAFRCVTGIVFLAYLSYLVTEWREVADGEEIGLGSRRSEANAMNAILGFVIIGVPCFWYTLHGVFRRRKS